MSLVERAEMQPAPTPPPLLPLTAAPGTPLSSGGLTVTTPASQTGEEQDDDGDNNDQRRPQPRPLRQRTVSGPIVQCESARSSPAAQLRLFVNDRPLEVGRTVENSTRSYSDGMESNLVSFVISLDDFRQLAAVDIPRLDKAAAGSLKSNAALSARTTTTARPAVPPASDRADANANVVFDDDSKLDRKRQSAADRRPRPKPKGSHRKDQVTSGQRRDSSGAADDDREANDDHQAAAQNQHQLQHQQLASVDLARLPAGHRDKQQLTAAAAAAEAASNQELAKEEQRAASSSYSNYIRVKCTSLVPAVGYEMTSELSVPLTLLVSARQLVPAAGDSGARSGSRTSSTAAATGEGQSERPERLLSPNGGGGGSLQTPRAVLIDRLAQASQPSGRLFLASSNNSSEPSSVQQQRQVLSRDPARKQRPTAFSQRLSSNNNNNNNRPAGE